MFCHGCRKILSLYGVKLESSHVLPKPIKLFRFLGMKLALTLFTERLALASSSTHACSGPS